MRVEPEVIGTASGLGAFALALLVAFAHRKATFALVGADVRRLKQFSKRKPSSKGPTLILPPAFWRFTTYALMISLLGSDPRFDGLWTARASCDIPSNPSTETVRVTTFGYDFDGHLIQANYPEGIINYGYDLATGRHISICTTNSEVAYGFDPLGRLKTVAVLKRNGVTVTNEVITYAYTAVGSRSTQTLPNGIITTYLYDSLNRLTNLTHSVGGTNLLASYTYQLHATGRRTGAVEILKTEDPGMPWLTNTLTWQYDGMYRLTNEVSICSTNTGTFTNAFVYDKVGNRWSKTHYQNGTTTLVTNVFNDNDQLLKEVTLIGGTATETNSYAYDLNGSLAAKTNVSGSSFTVLYGYDLKNKLSNVTTVGSGVTNTFLYNIQGIRVRSTVGGTATHYLIDANNHTGYQQILEELTAPGTTATRSYVIGDDVLAQASGAGPSYLLYDGHGSTRQLADNTGVVSQRYNYMAYGETLGSSSSGPLTSLLYCGEQFDSTLGMYNLRARFYSASNGRFNQRDPYTGNSFDPQSLHKYAYVNGDPSDGSDPTGMLMSLGDMMLWVGAWASVLAMYLAPVVKLAAIVASVIVGAMIISDQHFASEFAAVWVTTGGNPVAQVEEVLGEVRTLRTALTVQKTAASVNTLAAFTQAERAIIAEGKQIFASAEFAQIREARAAAQTLRVTIGNRTIQYQPGLPFSGMTWSEANGFIISDEAFASEEELAKTLAHELHRLRTSTALAKGTINEAAAAAETKAAYFFAEKAGKEVQLK